MHAHSLSEIVRLSIRYITTSYRGPLLFRTIESPERYFFSRCLEYSCRARSRSPEEGLLRQLLPVFHFVSDDYSNSLLLHNVGDYDDFVCKTQTPATAGRLLSPRLACSIFERSRADITSKSPLSTPEISKRIQSSRSSAFTSGSPI